MQPVCGIAFDQADLKIECFYLDETLQQRFWYHQRLCLSGALHHTHIQPLSQDNGLKKITHDFPLTEKLEVALECILILMVIDKDL